MAATPKSSRVVDVEDDEPTPKPAPKPAPAAKGDTVEVEIPIRYGAFYVTFPAVGDQGPVTKEFAGGEVVAVPKAVYERLHKAYGLEPYAPPAAKKPKS